MSEHPAREPETVAASFGEHLRAFHLSLPPDEQALLEQVVALAEAAAQEHDAAGYGADDQALKIEYDYRPPTVGLWLRSLMDTALKGNKKV